jgi:hypothetical protein
MKKYFLTILALICFVPALFAQREAVIPDAVEPEQEPVLNILKISPFHFIEGTFMLSYERMLRDQTMSIMVSAGIHSRERWFDESEQFGFQEEVQLRFYVLPPNNVSARGKRFFYFKGLYAGPFAAHRYRNQTLQVFDWILQQNVSTNERINEISGGVLLGAQMAFGNRLFLDVFLGGGVKRSFGRESGQGGVSALEVGYNGVIPKGGIQLGIGF